MGVVDRSDEFRQILADLSARGTGEFAGKLAPAAPPQVQSELNAWSAGIGSEINQMSEKVAELRKMAKQKGIFNDKTSEIQDLTFDVKKELDQLQKKIEVLESKAKGASSNRNYQAHASNIVETLKTRLLEVTKEFKEALESRTKALEQQDRRRQMYSAGSSTANNPFAQMQQRPAPSGDASDLEGGALLPGGGAQQQLYHHSRAEAVQSVQRTIGELATMFQKMAVMVTSQQEMIQRIDQDVDDTLSNVESGQEHLLKYFHHISSNRWLIMKVFAILIFFVVFFIIFLA
mmetsp:Transcript_52494/g.122832  ORF Transcript_52494/g.122832 Transcript_52494/m.122832 type:complete len:290 (+) Transcript_52494:89-958(+)